MNTGYPPLNWWYWWMTSRDHYMLFFDLCRNILLPFGHLSLLLFILIVPFHELSVWAKYTVCNNNDTIDILNIHSGPNSYSRGSTKYYFKTWWWSSSSSSSSSWSSTTSTTKYDDHYYNEHDFIKYLLNIMSINYVQTMAKRDPILTYNWSFHPRYGRVYLKVRKSPPRPCRFLPT